MQFNCIFRGFKGGEKRDGSGPHNWGNWTDDMKEEKKYANMCFVCVCSIGALCLYCEVYAWFVVYTSNFAGV